MTTISDKRAVNRVTLQDQADRSPPLLQAARIRNTAICSVMASFFRGLLSSVLSRSSLRPYDRQTRDHHVSRSKAAKRTFHPKLINWSYRNRGSVPRTQT